MRNQTSRGPWVVYSVVLRGKTVPMNVVCEQGEWDAMQHTNLGAQTLIRAGITNEGEAERLARAVPA